MLGGKLGLGFEFGVGMGCFGCIFSAIGWVGWFLVLGYWVIMICVLGGMNKRWPDGYVWMVEKKLYNTVSLFVYSLLYFINMLL